MKKKLFLALAISIMLVCFFALTISAAEPNNEGETVILDDGTVCALYDTDGNPLHWYVTATDADTGVKTYAYIAANDAAVDYYNGYSGGNQLGTMTITVDGTEYTKTSFAVLNLYGAKITSGYKIGNEITRFSKTFTGATNLEYAYVPLGTTVFNSEEFKNCSNLKYVNLEELTELTSVGSQSFNGCSKLFDGQTLDLSNTKLVSTATNAFATVAFTNVKLPEATFTTLGTQTFCKCQNLETVTGTKNATISLGNYSFQNCYKLKQLDGLIENGIMIIPEGITSVGLFTFSNCDAIKYVELPSTIEKIYQQGFSYMDNLKLVSFDAYNTAYKAAVANGETPTAFAFDNCGHFRGCKSLVAISLPEGLTEVNNRTLADCSALTAVYLPDTVKYFGSNGQGQGSFCNSTNMYFVDDSFTINQCLVDGVVDTSKLVLPEKPEVYYMPESLETFNGHRYTNDQWANATIFKNCTSLNSVLVFPESFTVMTTMRPFMDMGTEASPKTLVFLGNMTQMSIPHQSKYITYVFANKNDGSFADIEIVRTTGNANENGSSAYFCSTGMRYDLAVSGRIGTSNSCTEEDLANIATTIAAIHATGAAEDFKLRAPHLDSSTEPTCENNSSTTTYCFCGKEIATTEDENTALGHDGDGAEMKYHFPEENGAQNYYKDRLHSYVCQREGCGETVSTSQENTALFTSKGYSKSGDAIVFGIIANTDNITEYNTLTGKNVKYGVVVAKDNGGDLIDVNGTVKDNSTLSAEFSGTTYVLLQTKITGISEAAQTTTLHCCAFLADGTSVSYLYSNAETKEGAVGTTANSISHSTILDKV